MTEITHKHTERPYYEAANGETTNKWDDDPDRLSHAVERADYEPKTPVVFDIETTGKTPQRPLLVTAYDAAEQTVEVAYDYGSERNRDSRFCPDDSEVREAVHERFQNVPVRRVIVSRNVSQSWFERRVLSRVFDRPDKVLVGHNIGFDLGLLASPNWGVVDVLGEDSTEVDGAMTFKDVACLFRRAGAFGTIFRWFDMSDDGGPIRVNVCDTMTAAKSLWQPSGLDALADEYDVGGVDADGHGRLSLDYIGYNADDVRQTYRVWESLTEELQRGFDTNMTLDSVYSTASVAKDVLKRMGYDRAHYTESAANVIPEAYFGGRTEALKTGELVPDVAYMDILSQYPTVCGLTEVWDTMRARTVDVQHVEPQALPEPSHDALRDSSTWPDIAPYYVQIESDGAVLPVRTDTMGDTTRVYTAETEHAEGQATWYHYMDVLAAELLGDAEYSIEAAVEVVTEGVQDTQSASVGGRTIEADDNVMVRCIEERKAVQQENRQNGVGNDEGKNSRTKGLKITANSCYGIAAERIVEEVQDDDGNVTDRHDVAGQFYNPHVAATITAGGRLQLAIGEAAAQQSGGSLYYCDTDSLMTDAAVSDDVIGAYSNLNPYTAQPVCDADVLEIEKGETADEQEVELDGVDLFAVGVKKYCVLQDGEPVKWTEHGLGHFNNLRDNAEHPDRVRRFWGHLLGQRYGVYCTGDALLPDTLNEPVVWQQKASTEMVRCLLDEYLTDEFRYGDWVERLIMTDDAGPDRYYFGVSVAERCLRVEVADDGTLSHDVLQGDDVAQREGFKTIDTVLNDWWLDGDTGSEGRHSVTVTAREPVTKEATTTELAWEQVVVRVAQKLVFDLLD